MVFTRFLYYSVEVINNTVFKGEHSIDDNTISPIFLLYQYVTHVTIPI